MTRSRLDWLTLIALALSWLGIWLAWIPHESAALTQNAFYFSEWSTFLPEVRFGGLRPVPEYLRMGVALACVALSWSAHVIPDWKTRWLVRAIAVLPAVIMLPPYPDLLRLWFSESYGLRFTATSIGLIGVALSIIIDRQPERILHILIGVCSLVAGGLALYAYLTLRVPFNGYLVEPVQPGSGLILFVVSLLVVLLLELFRPLWDRLLPSSGTT